jgi:hypothetical protein
MTNLFSLKVEDYPTALHPRMQHVLWFSGQNGAKIPLVRLSDNLFTASDWNDFPVRFLSLPDALMWAEKGYVLVQNQKNGVITSKFTAKIAGTGIVARYDLNPPGKILVAFDIDDHAKKGILIRDGKVVHPVAAQLIKDLDTYTEITPSGFGLRLLCETDQLPPNILHAVTACTYHGLPLEILVSKFITVTCRRVEGTPREIMPRYIDKLAKELVVKESVAAGRAPTQIPKSARHDFFRRKLTTLIKDGWIRDRDLLMHTIRYLRDTYCEAPEEKTEQELSAFVEWALTKLSVNPLWQGNDSYLASKIIKEDERCSNVWAGKDRSPEGIDHLQTRLLEVCGNDADQAIRIFQGSPLYQVLEAPSEER